MFFSCDFDASQRATSQGATILTLAVFRPSLAVVEEGHMLLPWPERLVLVIHALSSSSALNGEKTLVGRVCPLFWGLFPETWIKIWGGPKLFWNLEPMGLQNFGPWGQNIGPWANIFTLRPKQGHTFSVDYNAYFSFPD